MTMAPVMSATPDPAAIIRRWRAIGIALALIVSLVSGLPAQRIQIDPITLGIGWLAGLLVAQRRVRALIGQAVPEAGRRRAVYEIAAAAMALGLLFAALVLRQTFGDRAFGQTRVAIVAIANVWGVAAIVLAGLLILAGRRGHRSTTPWQRPTVWIAAVSATAVVMSAGWLVLGLWRDHPPYPPTAINAHATAALTTFEDFDATAAALKIDGVGGLLVPGQSFVGRLDYDIPPGASAASTYHVVVLNTQTGAVAPLLFGPDGGGWDGFLEIDTPRRYPWLSALSWPPDGEPRAGPLAVSAPANQPGPIVFTGAFPEDGPIPLDHLAVALIFVGPHQQVYWALNVPIEAPA